MKKLKFLVFEFVKNVNGGYSCHSFFKKIKRAFLLNEVLKESIKDGSLKLN